MYKKERDVLEKGVTKRDECDGENFWYANK